MLIAILSISGLAAAFGLLLGYAAIRFKVEGDPIADQIDALLPQTQCGQCGFAGCRPYAEAMASGSADINHCPPGGEATIQSLADLLGVDPKPLDEDNGEHIEVPEVAVILEDYCIGCTKCIQACPVDAIVGAAKQMHTVIESECTGCKLCIPPCPVDCIVMEPIQQGLEQWTWPFPATPATQTTDLAEPS
ncbi:MAG TPA: electron transport complex subunit RsxB [Gammaproteobacteria bacterium]|nr:electron transport complex subunit RsxB [Gammaproteobacteria bacterium]